MLRDKTLTKVVAVRDRRRSLIRAVDLMEVRDAVLGIESPSLL